MYTVFHALSSDVLTFYNYEWIMVLFRVSVSSTGADYLANTTRSALHLFPAYNMHITIL